LKSLYLRIYVTLVALLLAFAFGAAWLFQRQIEQERGNFDAAATERLTAMALLIERALPGAEAPRQQQAEALEDWGRKLRLPIELLDAQGKRIAASDFFERHEDSPLAQRSTVRMTDGRSLVMLRLPRPFGPARERPAPFGADGAPAPGGPAFGEGPGGFNGAGRPPPRPDEPGPGMRPERDPRFDGGPGRDFRRPGFEHQPRSWWTAITSALPPGQVLAVLLVLLFIAVAIAAYPVVRRLTRRLEHLKQGVEQFGSGKLDLRIADDARDEVGALARSFNRAAERIEELVRSHRSLLANASHELRSPLARMKMAFSMLDEAQPALRDKLKREIETNIAELDALVEEVLLASRLEAGQQQSPPDRVDLLGLAAEEAARSGAELDIQSGVDSFHAVGEERLLRRALRNLLENAKRYGGGEALLELRRVDGARIELRVCDRGPGVPDEMRERIFEPFFRLPGHAEQAGGVGLGLSLVRQIAERHGGRVVCEPREGGGSCFVLSLPVA
jgi:signal transduction histidine kinase